MKGTDKGNDPKNTSENTFKDKFKDLPVVGGKSNWALSELPVSANKLILKVRNPATRA